MENRVKNFEQELNKTMLLVENCILNYDNPIIIMQGYEYFSEVIALLAKMHNHLEAVLKLSEMKMEDEAMIIVRSMFNIELWIENFIHSDNKETLRKEFLAQPLIGERTLIRNMKKAIENAGDAYPEEFHELYRTFDFEERVNKINEDLKCEGFDKLNFKRIIDLALIKPELYGMYATFYNKASEIEHSSASSTSKYKNKIIKDYPVEKVFSVDTHSTNEEKLYEVLTFASMFYGSSVFEIIQHINKYFPQWFETYSDDFTRLAIQLREIGFR